MRRKSGSFQAIIGVVLSVLLLGALVAGYFSWRDNGPLKGWSSDKVAVSEDQQVEAEGSVRNAPVLASSPPSPVAAPEGAEAAKQASQAVERVAEQQGGLDQRLAAAEQRLNRLDLQAQAAAGNVARAEGLLIAFAARRSLVRGAKLGYLADQLRLRFSDALPNAVNTVVETSRNPITLDELIARLDGLSSELQSSDEAPTLERLQQQISGLFDIRRESSPSPQPERRLERARFFLESGRVDFAIEEVSQMPGADKAKNWMADAKRYADAQYALDLIEASAVQEPRRLRDGEGHRVEQPSPVKE